MNNEFDNIEQIFKDGEQQLNQPAPTNIWDRLNNRLDDLPEYTDEDQSSTSSGRTLLFRRLGAIAAGVAFIVLIGLVYFLNPQSPTNSTLSASNIPAIQTVSDLIASTPSSAYRHRQQQVALLESYGYFDMAMVESPIQVAQAESEKDKSAARQNVDKTRSKDKVFENSLAENEPSVEFRDDQIAQADFIQESAPSIPSDLDISDVLLEEVEEMQEPTIAEDAAISGLSVTQKADKAHNQADEQHDRSVAKDEVSSKKVESSVRAESQSVAGKAAASAAESPAPAATIQVAPTVGLPTSPAPALEYDNLGGVIQNAPVQSGVSGDIRDEEALYPYSDLAPMQWMMGSWQGSSLNGQNIETWNWKNARTIIGKAKMMSEGTERYAESMTFKTKRGQIMLSFTDSKGQTIMTYKLIEQSARRISFEKMGGSGPTDLVIDRLAARRLKFTFSGLQDDLGTDFIRNRTIEKNGKLMRELSKSSERQ